MMKNYRLQPIVDLRDASLKPLAFELLCGRTACGEKDYEGWVSWYLSMSERLRSEPPIGAPVFLNLDAWHTCDPRILRAVEVVMANHECVLEWTERIDQTGPEIYEQAAAAFNAWRKRGIKTAVDDIGADYGYDGIGRVLRVLHRYAKIDIQVIRRSRFPGGILMLRHMAAMLTGLGCQVIAEGIESEDDLLRCRQSGIPLGQGFLFGADRKRPVLDATENAFDLTAVMAAQASV